MGRKRPCYLTQGFSDRSVPKKRDRSKKRDSLTSQQGIPWLLQRLIDRWSRVVGGADAEVNKGKAHAFCGNTSHGNTRSSKYQRYIWVSLNTFIWKMSKYKCKKQMIPWYGVHWQRNLSYLARKIRKSWAWNYKLTGKLTVLASWKLFLWIFAEYGRSRCVSKNVKMLSIGLWTHKNISCS